MGKPTTKVRVDEAAKERISAKTLQSIEGIEEYLDITITGVGMDIKGQVRWITVRRIGGLVVKVLIPCLIWAGWKGAPHIVELMKRIH